MAKKKKKSIPVGQVVSIDKLKLEPRFPKRGTKYQKIFDQASTLKPGQSFVVSCKGTTAKVMQNRIGASMRKRGIAARKGCRIQIRATLDGNIAICCVKRK